MLLCAPRGVRSCWWRDCWLCGLGVLRCDAEGPARKRGMNEVEDVGLCLRLNEILGIHLSQKQIPTGCPMRTAQRGRHSAGRPPTALPHRWPHLQRQAAFHSLCVRTLGGWRMLRRVRAETGLLKSLTSHRRMFDGSGRFILYRRIVSLMLELPVVSLRRAESASVHARSANSRVLST